MGQSEGANIFDAEGMLERLGGDRELAVMVLNTFLDDCPKRIRDFRAQIDSGDLKSAERSVHSVKGASANISAEGLRECAAGLETAVKSGDTGALNGGIGDLEQKFLELELELRRWIAA
jgi:HPt (histidine-containing phosphotransfer) domain-containing protein